MTISNCTFYWLVFHKFFPTSKTMERRIVSADSNRRKSDTKEYLPDWLEVKKPSENKNTDRVIPTEFSKHRRSSSDKIIEKVRQITD